VLYSNSDTSVAVFNITKGRSALGGEWGGCVPCSQGLVHIVAVILITVLSAHTHGRCHMTLL